MQLKIKLILQVTNNKMAHSLWVISIFCILLFIGLAKAENEEDKKFELMVSDERVKHFALSNAELNFSTSSPKNFIWNEKNIVPPEFVDAAVFSSFKQEFVGYDPLNRDRFEIQIYSAKIFPTRIAMAAGYSVLLASQWGKFNFGIQTHSPEFGEAIVGDDSSGIMIVSRITTIRRGEHLVIIRSIFNSEYSKKYGRSIAAFIGSISFSERLENDPIKDTSKKVKLGDQKFGTIFKYTMPQNWELLPIQKEEKNEKLIHMWVDIDDPNRNSGAMIFIAKPENIKIDVEKNKIDQQGMANFSYTIATIMLDNLLPGKSYKLIPHEKNSFGDLNNITAFNSLYIYTALIEKNPSKVSILLSADKYGRVIVSAVLSGGGGDLYTRGTKNHGDYVQGILLQNQIEYWQKQAELTKESND